MKMQALKVFAVAVFIALLGASSAKASSTMLRADIPFDFTVGSATLPAGTYTVTEATPGVLLIRNDNPGPDPAFVLANLVETTKAQDSAKLIFHRYGNSYFLSEVWAADAFPGYSVVKSPEEISASKELTSANRPDPLPVVVVASLQ